MTVKTQIESLTKPTSIALGVFDGVHIGHQAVIGEAVNGEADGLMPVVFTFDTGGEKPEHKKGQETILTTSLKRKKMEELGVSVIYEIPFDTVKDYSHSCTPRKLFAVSTSVSEKTLPAIPNY